MKVIALNLLFLIGMQAFAADSIYGSWHNATLAWNHDTYSPEALSTIREDGTITWEVLFQGATQKRVVLFRSKITEKTVQSLEVLYRTLCKDTKFSADDEPRPYKIDQDTLSVAGIAPMTRATPEQIKFFSSLQEGCK